MAKLIMTAEQMKDRDTWLDVRSHGIGGSDASVIVGLNPWKSLFTLWMEKTGQAEPEELGDNERVYWGNVLEETVAKEFTKRTGKKVQRRGVLQHDDIPYLLASVDRLVVGENAGLECKTAGASKAKEWEDDKIPDAYYVQCQHYMAVTGAERWYIAALIGGNKFVWKEIPRNEDDISALMEAEKEFWRKVEAREMPDVDGSESCTKALSAKFPGGGAAIALPPEAEEAIRYLDELKKIQKDMEGQIAFHENTLRVILGNAEAGTTADGRRVTWKPQAGRVTIDGKRLKTELPEIYKRYAKQGKGYRVLRIAG